ncbi:pirin family protein [Microbulbifer harenosus]|uniref:Pirin family protein n=1 Tax=Microbulbifer harenosus TaxID=2576840 RepID=A0ABY2UDT4_9GAMM|nr:MULTISPECIES: pirin family protein [Microbulbifer]QIL90604.1 cupin domain-containing protein [Microbulbifer sp. SH-1]TLM74375.1 pirin family protein [Microbulbifer harenosus]
MLYLRRADERGKADFGWLESRHSFSFGHYHDPKHMGFSALRVINDDTVAPGAGFGTHGHRDMEIISYVLSGAIAHKDSMGNQFVVPAGDVQRMTAGTGVTHSEYNDSKTDPLKFLQIWIIPNQRGLEPGYEQKAIPQRGPLTPLVTPDGRDGSLTVHQEASMHRLQLPAGASFALSAEKGVGYLHLLEGDVEANGNHLSAGDGLGTLDEPLSLEAGAGGVTALWFDLPRGDS